MAYFVRSILLIAMLLFPVAAMAGHQLEVEDTATQGKGNFLFELTGDYLKSNEFKTTKWTGIITAGSGEHTEVTLEVPYLLQHQNLVDQNVSGKGDVRLKMKGQIFENEVKQSMAYLVFVDLPTGDAAKGLGTDNVVWGVKLVDSQECRNCIFHVNLGYEVFGKALRKGHFEEDYALTFGFAAGHRFTNSFRVLTEIAGEIRKEPDRNLKPFTLLAGIVYDIAKSWYVDLGARAGLNKDAEDYAVLAGTGWRF
ncbi:MAG TPA: transporter [Nitrospirota bacterium]|nr:transporter [Nitrospirota bacterium]